MSKAQLVVSLYNINNSDFLLSKTSAGTEVFLWVFVVQVYSPEVKRLNKK
jgi:hypothetical protein